MPDNESLVALLKPFSRVQPRQLYTAIADVDMRPTQEVTTDTVKNGAAAEDDKLNVDLCVSS
jgi:hypothetical protein